MNAKSLFLLLILIPYYAISQPYHDAAAFGLKGPVKKCVISERGGCNLFDFKEVSFNEDGSLSSWYNPEERNFEVTRNSDGFILDLTYTEPGLLFLSITEKYSFTYKNNFLYNRVCKTYDAKYSYIFSFENKNIFSVHSSTKVTTEFSLAKLFGNLCDRESEAKYRINKVDKHGNIIDLDRVIYNYEEKKYVYQYNITIDIVYWDDDSNDSSSPSGKLISDVQIPSPRSVTVNDLKSCPYGIINPQNGNIWSVRFQDIENAFNKTKYWELKRYSTCVYRLYETTGYDYNGIPITVASADTDPGCNFAETYEYSFHKNITGIIPKYESRPNYSSLPHWTFQEANDFYNTILNDFKSVGIELHTVETGKDFRVSNGFDETSYYEVRLQKQLSKYSAIISVQIIISKRHSIYDNSKAP